MIPGARVKQFRKSLGLNQEQFAPVIGVTAQAVVSAIESGASGISHSVLMKLITLNVNPVWLFNGEGDMIIPGLKKKLSAKSKEVTNEDILMEIKELRKDIKKIK